MKYILLVTILFLSDWCSNIKKSNKEEPLAQVGKQLIYPYEINGLIKHGLSKEDSTMMVASLVDKWVRKQLILQKAELNLNEEEKDVNKELEEYRTSLIIYKYEQKLIKEKLDTVVNYKEIEQYYNKNTSNFILNYDIVKAQFIKLHLHAPNMEKVKEWMRSYSEDNIKLLEEYCYQYAVKYDYFNEEWISFDNIKMLLPVKISDNEQYLRNNKLIELKDTSYFYMLNIKDFKLKGTISPLKFIDSDIKSIILLKRKQKLISDLEDRIYYDALKHNNFTIFKN